MPTYEYKCSECGHHFDKFQSISQAAIRECPKCSGEVEGLISRNSGGFIFKGSGFYATDYRSEDYKKKARTDPSSSSSDTKKDTKVA